MASLCFGGALAVGLGLATAVFIFGTAFSTVILYYFGGFRLSLAVSQDTSISVLAPAVVLVATGVSGPIEAQVATAFAAIGASAVATGVVFWTVGRLGLGGLVRMFPYPVLAGFLASSGYLLVNAGLYMVTDQTSLGARALAAADPNVQLRLLPALVIAVAMLIATRIWVGAKPVLIIIFLALVSYYLLAAILGVDQLRAVELGLLPKVGDSGSGTLSLAMLGLIDWAAVLHLAPTIAAVVLLNLIGVLLNTSGVELATGQDVDENRELRVIGVANLFVGGLGGITCFLQGGATVVSSKLGGQSGAMITGYVAVTLAFCLFAPMIVAIVPVFVPAALVMFIGLSMLLDWLIGTWRRLILIDWLIVASIVLATAFLGVLPAIAVGLFLSLVGFAIASIRLPVIRHATSVAMRRSIRDRIAPQSEVLMREGDRVRILFLQGPLFFGSVEQVVSRLREMTSTPRGLSAVVLDFSAVHSFDSSACAALEKLAHLMRASGIAPHVTGISPGLNAVFKRWGLLLADADELFASHLFRHWPSLDSAIEHCETALLAEQHQDAQEIDIAKIILELGNNNPRTADLIGRMQRYELVPGDRLIVASERTHDVFFLVSGQLGVHLPTASGHKIRVRAMGPGTIVGEIAYLTGQPRNADVVCEEATVVLCLTEVDISDIEANDRDLAALMLAILGRSLAAKLAQSNGILTNLQAG